MERMERTEDSKDGGRMTEDEEDGGRRGLRLRTEDGGRRTEDEEDEVGQRGWRGWRTVGMGDEGRRGWRWRRRTKMEWRTEEEETRTERMEDREPRGWRRRQRLERTRIELRRRMEEDGEDGGIPVTLLPY